jgi:hypothetical protein
MFSDGNLLQLIGILVAGQDCLDSVFKGKLRVKSTILLIVCIPDNFQSVMNDCYGNYSRMSLVGRKQQLLANPTIAHFGR